MRVTTSIGVLFAVSALLASCSDEVAPQVEADDATVQTIDDANFGIDAQDDDQSGDASVDGEDSADAGEDSADAGEDTAADAVDDTGEERDTSDEVGEDDIGDLGQDAADGGDTGIDVEADATDDSSSDATDDASSDAADDASSDATDDSSSDATDDSSSDAADDASSDATDASADLADAADTGSDTADVGDVGTDTADLVDATETGDAQDLADTADANDSASDPEIEPVCIDLDEDGRGANCGAADCDDDDPDNWDSCDTCVDEDHDGWFVGCNQYEKVYDGPDCNDRALHQWQTMTAYVDEDSDFEGAGEPLEVCAGLYLPYGFADVDGDCRDHDPLSNTTAVDLPGDSVNNDCFGGGDEPIDGDTAVFVDAINGSDDDGGGTIELGTRENPFRTVRAADEATADGRFLVLAEGTYNQSIVTSVMGGFCNKEGTWTRNPADCPSRVDTIVNIRGDRGQIFVDGLEMTAPSASSSQVRILPSSCDAIRVSNVSTLYTSASGAAGSAHNGLGLSAPGDCTVSVHDVTIVESSPRTDRAFVGVSIWAAARAFVSDVTVSIDETETEGSITWFDGFDIEADQVYMLGNEVIIDSDRVATPVGIELRKTKRVVLENNNVELFGSANHWAVWIINTASAVLLDNSLSSITDGDAYTVVRLYAEEATATENWIYGRSAGSVTAVDFGGHLLLSSNNAVTAHGKDSAFAVDSSGDHFASVNSTFVVTTEGFGSAVRTQGRVTSMVNNAMSTSSGSTNRCLDAQTELWWATNACWGDAEFEYGRDISSLEDFVACRWDGCRVVDGVVSAPLQLDTSPNVVVELFENSPLIDAGVDPAGLFGFPPVSNAIVGRRPIDIAGKGDGVDDWDIGAWEFNDD